MKVLLFCCTGAYNICMAVSLKEAEVTVDALEPRDQIQLAQYLFSRLAEAALANERPTAEQAWREFRRVGEQLAAAPSTESATQLISDMRR
jgi:hypothetical protein